MKKQFYTLLLAVLLIFSMAACSSEKQDGDKISDAPSQGMEQTLQTSQQEDQSTHPDHAEYVILRSVRGERTGVYEYDKNGNNVKITYYYGSDQAYNGYDLFDYDGNGQMIEYREYSMNDELREHHTYRYDDTGNMIEDVEYREDGTPYERWTYEYDESGKLLREIRFSCYSDEEQEVFSAWEYRYNEDGVLMYKIDYNDDFTKELYRETYFYDENGHLSRTESRDCGSDKLMYYRVITCNERGEMIRDEWYMGSDTTPREVDEYSYTYDEYDRLVEKNGTTYEYGPIGD